MKAVLEKSAPTSGESNATKKEKWLNDMHHFKQFEKEHTNSYVLRFNELMKRGESIFGTTADIFLQYQSEPFLAKRLLSKGSKTALSLKYMMKNHCEMAKTIFGFPNLVTGR